MGVHSLMGIEVPIIGSSLIKWVQLSVPASNALSDYHRDGSVLPVVPSMPEDVSSCSVIGNPPTYLISKICKGLPNALEVLELCAEKEFPRIGLRFHFPEALFPFAHICKNEVDNASVYPYLLYALSVSGVAYCFQLKNISSYSSWSGFSTKEVIQLDLRNYLPHAPVCAVAAVAGRLVIGREDGSVASYRFGLLDQNDPGFMQEMRDDAGFGRLWGFVTLVSRGRITGSVKALNLALFHDKEMVFVLHSDGTIKIWDLLSGAKIFSLSIPGSSFEHLWVGEANNGVSVISLAILCKEDLVSSERICICKLNFAHRDKTSYSLDYLTLPQGKIIDVNLASNKIGVLIEDQLIVQDLLHLNSNVEGHRYALQEAFVADQLFQSSEHGLDDLYELTCSIFSRQKDQVASFLSSIFLHKLLHPGVYNSFVIRHLLEQYEKHWSDAEFQALTVDGLREEILSVIEQQVLYESPSSIFKCWKDFCSRYFDCWRRRNASFGLIVDSLTGAIGIIRENSISLFRNLEKIEQVLYGSLITVDDFTKFGLEMSNALDFELLLEMLQCNHNLRQQLGGAVLPILYEALVSSPIVPFDDIVPVSLKMLESGCNFPVVVSDMDRQKQMAENKKLRGFSVIMLLSLQALHRKANGWGKVLEVIERYVQFLVPITIEETVNSNMPSNITTSAVVQATSQVAKAMLESSLDVLLFLHYLLNNSGQILLFQPEITRIQLDLIPMISETVMEWLIIYFIATTPSESGAVEDFNSQLSSLRIDGSTAKAPWTEKLGSFNFRLASVLLMNANGCFDSQNSLSLCSLPGPENFVSLVQNFTSWMILGGPGENVKSIFEHSANIALILLKHAQYNAAETILLITDVHLKKEKTSGSIQHANKEWSVLHHLLGCCQVAQAHVENRVALREGKVSEAVKCFFKASSGEEAAHALQRLPPEAGLPHLGFSDCESDASWKFSYYQWVMQVFEQYNMSQAACQFALAALEQVDEVCFHDGNADQDALIGESTIAIKGRLWANVFKFMLDLNEFYDAYCAMVSNPDEESKNICLRRLIIVLDECGATKMLCNGQLPFIGLIEKTERELAWKAARSDIVTKSNPFKLLYALEMHRQNWRKAASYMYLYSTRLKTEIALRSSPNSNLVMQERLNAISAAINALHLLHPANAWVDLHLDGSHFHNDFQLNKKARLSENRTASADTSSSRPSSFLSIEKLEDEFVLASAEHLLSMENVKWSHTGNQTPPLDLVDHLVQADLYDMAFTVLFRFWKGSRLNKGLERVFSALSLKCCPDKSVSRVAGSNHLLLIPSKDEEHMSEAYDVNPSVRQPKSNSQWEVLDIYLEKYRRVHPKLPVVVAETLLQSDFQIELPLWLVHMFKGGHKKATWGMAGQESGPASLLCLYVDYGRYSEATDLLIEYLEAYRSARPEDLVCRKSPFAAWFPYITIERLWCQLEASIHAGHMIEQCEKLKNLIYGSLKGHLHMVKEDSEDSLSSFR